MNVDKVIKELTSNKMLTDVNVYDQAYVAGSFDKEKWFEATAVLVGFKFKVLEETRKEWLALLDDANISSSNV